MVRSKLFIGCAFFFYTFTALAQDRYMVFFSDKESTPYSIDNPSAFLSQRALDRRDKLDISITEEDLPVDPSYIAQVAEMGVSVYFSTKWFNAVLTEMTTAQATTVGGLSFVDSVVYVAKGIKLNASPGTYEVAETFLDPASVSSTTEVQLSMLGADEMHDDGYNGEGMMIAVFDAGFPGVNQYKPFEHIFDDDRLVATRDFIANTGNVFQYDTHGASVFSNIASDYEEVVGTAPKASFVLCVTEDVTKEYRVEEYNWLFAAEFADSLGVDVINGSLGYFSFSDSDMDYTYEDMNGENSLVAQAANKASSKGMIVVVSAGNEGNNSSWRYITTPGDAFDVLTVGSVTSAYNKSGFSSVGPTSDGRIKPDVCAMGSGATIFYASVQSSGEVQSARITTGNGTSYSSPQIAGFAAGIWQANPDWSHLEVMEAIRFSGSSSMSPDSLFGYGVPEYKLAVNGATIDAADVIEDKLKVYPNPFSDNKVTVVFGKMTIKGKLEILVQDLQGKSVFHEKIDGTDIPNELEINIEPSRSGVYFLILRSKRFSKTVKLIKI